MPDEPQGDDDCDAFDAFDTLAALDCGVLCASGELRIVFANAAATECLVGRADARPDALIGRALLDLVGAEARTSHEALLRAALADGVPRTCRLVPLRGERGSIEAAACRSRRGTLVVTLRPAVAERQMPHAAQVPNEQERLRALTRVMAAEADATKLLDTVCHAAVELCNARGGTVAEVDGDYGTFICTVGHPDELRGKRFTLEDTLTARALAEYRSTGRLTAARADAGEADDEAFYPFLDDGRLVGPLLLAPLGAHGELLGVLAVSRAIGEPAFSDADEQRLRVLADHASLALWKARLIEEALEANETKSNFLAMVSHELRTPLTALTGYGELLADEIMGPLTGGQHEIVERVRAVTHQLTAMIEEILTFSALEAGRELVRPRRIETGEVLHAVASVIEPLAVAKGLTFSYRAAAALPPIVTDPDKVRQILVNLAGNAVKFTERGEVHLHVAPDRGGGIRFSVRDTGVGIAAPDLKRLFQPFMQLDTGLTRRYGGTGLGLYISRGLAELLGGRIDVASEPGRGSTFTLVLPETTPER
ncbi:PAS domain-containing sensor histidine kinase [Gemmatirosa kalamazoonensis]|nr:ATP-binding protein [Gemmatirosa kalamazoonensis]